MHDRTPARSEVLRLLGEVGPDLRRRYGVVSLSLFGSVVRDEAAGTSDIDVLVEFERPIDLFRFDDLEHELSALLGHAVDLVEPEALHPALRDEILAEALRAA